jgi:hypothetical protein
MNKVSLFAIRHKESRELLYLDDRVEYWYNGEYVDRKTEYHLCRGNECEGGNRIWVSEKQEDAVNVCLFSSSKEISTPDRPYNTYCGQLEVVLLTEI